ncbi:PhzF family phenazine biosynthesis protein [Solirubrobacter pauli]|uniref:PhzF family phenazine biosynthesis protein n=1 Tax=Solirubrobacter pauli TaxID=166793 RepID=A0A660L2F9_9ACTN|nr:PhzF family phenazine biosynthesis protein [Solirubrobacter pauli]RKQ88181.1 PhzF family phenazine biosynthesis protein [Solirubrobacter pauli]
MPALRFALVDVFADVALTGNPLAVVDGGEGLSDDVLADIAREFNQSETTFVLPGDGGATRRLRSFTTGRAEVGGAGHNALGAWWWLAHDGQVGPGDHVQRIGDDELPLTIERAGERFSVSMRQGEPVRSAGTVAAATLAAPLALDPEDLTAGRVVSTGTPHLLVPASGREAVDRAAPHAPALKQVLAEAGAEGCYLYALDGPDPYARFFNPTVGLWEDPATGTAAGPLAWSLVESGSVAGPEVVVEQGHAMGRPSRLRLRIEGAAVTLSGTAVLVAEGHIHVPG